MIGVFSLELLQLYTFLYQKLNKEFTIVHSLDGFDEISLTSFIKISTRIGEKIVHPTELGFETHSLEALSGGDSIKDAATILINILENKGTIAQNQVVKTNAAFAICTAKPKINFSDALAMADESIKSGKAKNVLMSLLKQN